MVCACFLHFRVQAQVTVAPTGAFTVGRPSDFRLAGVPQASNPFDPEEIAVDATVTSPTGGVMVLPAFYFQDYSRQLVGSNESLTALGSPEWRVRFTPQMAGDHQVSIQVRRPGQPVAGGGPVSFTVSTGELARVQFVGVSQNRRYFTKGAAGDPHILVGHCACWPGTRGTADYEDWFGAMAAAGENYTRLWMCPWAFGIENPGSPVTRFALDRAWQLDWVLREAELKGIHVLLCLEYHGMFETEPDYWGGNNYWTNNPYHTRLGGPCTNPNDFFSSASARQLYQKRLRYLVGRYGASPGLLAWQFFNEIDNVDRLLTRADVADWHGVMGAWLKSQDPYHHLVTTSLTSGSDRPEIWTLPALDFAVYHSYGQPDPATGFSARSQAMASQYDKPVLIGEFGMNWQGWVDSDDPFRRGFRQGVWGGLLGGSAGTAMSWWWEQIHAEDLYGIYRSAADFVSRSSLGRGNWRAAALAPADPTPVTVGDLRPGEPSFQATLTLDGQWGARPAGRFALPTADAAAESPGALAGFVHGTSHSELRTPFQVSLWLGTNATVVLHLNSVSEGAVMNVRVDGTSVWSRSIPNRDGGYQVNNEYNTNYTVPLSAGRHTVEIRNTGADWYYLDWVRFEEVLPAEYAGGWKPRPVAIGLQGEGETLLYVAHPLLRYPARSTVAALEPVIGATLSFTNEVEEAHAAVWFDAATGANRGVTVSHAGSGGLWDLPVPGLAEDLVARVVRMPRLSWLITPFGLDVVLQGDPGRQYALEGTRDWSQWNPMGQRVDLGGEVRWSIPLEDGQTFLRAVVY
jgi:hypothetical protein